MKILDAIRILAAETPNFPNLRQHRKGPIWSWEGLTMSSIDLGMQGTGKSAARANDIVDYKLAYPQRVVILFDQSGPLSTETIRQFLHRTSEAEVIRTIIYNRVGDENYVLPQPELSPEYPESMEEQTRRVIQNYRSLFPDLIMRNPTIGDMALGSLGSNIIRLLGAIRNDQDECWQPTEAKTLLTDEAKLEWFVKRFGGLVPTAKHYFEHEYHRKTSERDRRMSRHTLVGILDAIETKYMRARVGYPKPAMTMERAEKQGGLLIYDYSPLINSEAEMNYAVIQDFSFIMNWVNRRRPHDPTVEPLLWVFDEMRSLFKIPSMAQKLAWMPSWCRSRKLMPVYIAQELSQFAPELQPHVWGAGNRRIFRLANHNDAYEVAKQIFNYSRTKVKLEALTERQNPIMEPDRGQYLEIANWIQNFKDRECIVQRYLSEHEKDAYIRHIPRTRDIPAFREVSDREVEEIKEMLLRRHGVSIRDALREVNDRLRALPSPSSGPPTLE